MSTIILKRFVRKFKGGARTHYSIRLRSDRSFQLFHDNPYVGIKQSYEFEDVAISGLYADVVTAEKELLRMYPDLEPKY
jgi:hypothetical protein